MLHGFNLAQDCANLQSCERAGIRAPRETAWPSARRHALVRRGSGKGQPRKVVLRLAVYDVEGSPAGDRTWAAECGVGSAWVEPRGSGRLRVWRSDFATRWSRKRTAGGS